MTHDELRAIEGARLPMPYAKKAFADLKSHKKWAESAEKCSNLLQKHGIACLYGDINTGKTQMGVTIGKTRLLVGRRGVRFYPLSQFLMFFEDRDRNWESLADEFLKPGILILDSCHLVEPTGRNHAAIDYLLTQRMEKTNPDPKTWQQTLFIYDAHGQALPTYLSPGQRGEFSRVQPYIECKWPPFPIQ